MAQRLTGRIKATNRDRGYGFIHVFGGDDVFFHATAFHPAGETIFEDLQPGTAVSFNLTTGPDGRERAADVRLA